MSGVFERAIELPATLPPAMAQQAALSIGDIYIVADERGRAQGPALIEAGKVAFTKTGNIRTAFVLMSKPGFANNRQNSRKQIGVLTALTRGLLPAAVSWSPADACGLPG